MSTTPDDRYDSAPPTIRRPDLQTSSVEVSLPCDTPAEEGPHSVDGLRDHWGGEPQSDSEVAGRLLDDWGQQPDGSNDGEGTRRAKPSPSMSHLVELQELLRLAAGSLGSAPTPRLPQCGDELFGFRLCQELGRGAFARVFLAEQADLAGRPVAVKVSAIEGSEPQTLAQLQHTNIVPIYSVHEDPDVALRLVCMPYFGGASLSQVLKVVWTRSPSPAHGRQLVEAIEEVEPVRPPEGANDQPAEGETSLTALRDESYVRAVMWITARLAEGLQHAHSRGVLHRDIKPSNILLARDGQPMLLDFNLAHDPNAGSAGALLGGTVAYMSPEHLRAMLTRKRELLDKVDRRSDVYSLGMVLYEMLVGRRPFEQSGSYSAVAAQLEAMAEERGKAAPSLIGRRPDVSWGLESVLRKCLAPEPADRYQHAEELAEDLRRLLEDRPLRHAPELSRVERVRKWGRRHPRLTSAGLVTLAALLLLGAAGSALAVVLHRLSDTGEQLGAAESRQRRQAFEAGTLRALCQVPPDLELHGPLLERTSVCEETLAVYGIREGDPWKQPAEWSRFSAEERRKLSEDVRELLLLLAAARVEPAPHDPTALRRALALLDQAEGMEGLTPCRALWLDRADWLEKLGRRDDARAARRKAEHVPVTTARDHCLLATAQARNGDAESQARAIATLDRALALDPRHYWAWIQRGICHGERGDWLRAARDFAHCTGLWPEFYLAHFNLGWALERAGDTAEAVAHYTQALKRNPDFVAGYLNRGQACLELKRYAQALADADSALRLGDDSLLAHGIRGVALERLGRHAEADAAFRSALDRAGSVPRRERLRMHCCYGFAVLGRSSEEARKAFDRVLREDPHNAEALYSRAMLAMPHPERADEALQFFNQALAVNPQLVEARRYRAVLQARQGAIKRAEDDINWCLDRNPRAPDTLYAAACVTALAAAKTTDSALMSQAVDLLRKAFAAGAAPDRAASDPDLAGLRSDPAFQQLLDEAKRDNGK